MLHGMVITGHMMSWLCIQLTWYWHVNYLTLDIRYLTIDMLSPNTWHLLLGIDILDLILWHQTRYDYTRHLYFFAHIWLSFYGDLTLDILSYTWIHVLLHLTCSSCYNILVNSRKLIIMDTIVIIRTYTGMGKTDEYWYSLYVYDSRKCRAATLLGFTWRPPSVSIGYDGTPTPLTSFRVRNKPWAYSSGSNDTLLQFERTISPDT